MTPEDIAAVRVLVDEVDRQRAVMREAGEALRRQTHALEIALREVERSHLVEAQAISAMNAAHVAARSAEAENVALRDRVAFLVASRDAADRAVDVLEDQGDQLVALVREFASAMPEVEPSYQTSDLEVTRADLPSLFVNEDGPTITVAQAKSRLFAKLPMVASP